jgi:hypothetical protein
MSSPVPISMPDDLLQEIESAASDLGFSKQDVIRQSVKLGIPKLRKQLMVDTSLKPLTKEEARRAFAPDPEWDKLEAHMVKHAKHLPPEPD